MEDKKREKRKRKNHTDRKRKENFYIFEPVFVVIGSGSE